ncbi:efflux RND transporter periplasmic adaptor subunit [Plastorhodobacter daqingensis]|uniref:Efflux RND transporter periplasmic adaptor subunit n=1 Tax=Plastorhodobacter daqingensis TaxID=1387281 RepID=A0ABW2UPB7_9RHOB
MRFFPILTAVLVTISLYLLVIERPQLMRMARVVPPPATEPAPAAAAQPGTTGASELPEGRLVGVVAAQSTARPVDTAVLLRGRTEAARAVEVRAETTAQVVSEPLRRGAMVAAGDLLCELSPGTRTAALLEAEARLAEAEINFRAADQLAAGGFASETRAAGARAALQTAQAAVEAAQTEIARLRITAPFDGTLESDAAETGSLLQAGGLCATVIQLDPIRLVGFVPETEVARVEIGAPAGARLVSGTELRGTVSFQSRSADPATRTFRVEVQVPNPDLAIRDGQTAEIVIGAAGVGAHLLPASALTLDDSGRLGLRIVTDDPAGGQIAGFAPVSVLRDSPQGVWVTGLPDSVAVIVVGQEYVTDGTRLAVTWRELQP